MSEGYKGYCHECQLKRGGVPPKHNPAMLGNTCALGDCIGCDKKDTSISYSCDYDWPDGRRAVWD